MGRQRRLLGLIHVATGEAGKRHYLAHRRIFPHVPLYAGERAARVLPVGPHQREAVGMDFQTTASNRAGRLPAIVDGGKGEGLLPLIVIGPQRLRSEEHTSELQSLMRISYAVFCLKKKNKQIHVDE